MGDSAEDLRRWASSAFRPARLHGIHPRVLRAEALQRMIADRDADLREDRSAKIILGVVGSLLAVGAGYLAGSLWKNRKRLKSIPLHPTLPSWTMT